MDLVSTLDFYPSHNYDSGVQNSICINRSGIAVEVHKSENKDVLHYRTATFNPPATTTQVSSNDSGSSSTSEAITPLWSTSLDFDTGILPSVAIQDNTVVEVHQSETREELYYRVGTLVQNSVHLNTFSVSWSGTSSHYDSGKRPHISFCPDSLDIVCVHESPSSPSLFYRIGTVNPTQKSITFSASHLYDSGLTPSISWIPKTLYCIEIHKSERRDVLYSKIGRVHKDSGSISWASSHDFDTGINPNVTSCMFVTEGGVREERGKGEVNFIEVHQSENRSKVYYRLGKLLVEEGKKEEAGCEVEWGKSHVMDSGVRPSVTMNERIIVEVHKSENYDKLYTRFAEVSLRPEVAAAQEKIRKEKQSGDALIATIQGNNTNHNNAVAVIGSPTGPATVTVSIATNQPDVVVLKGSGF